MLEIKTKAKLGIDEKNSFDIYLSNDKHKSGYVWDMHGHEFFELELCVEDGGRQRVNGKEYAIEKGSVHLLTSSDFHEINYMKGTHMIGVRFNQSVLDFSILESIFLVRQTLVFKLEDEEFELVHRLLELMYEYRNNMLDSLNGVKAKALPHREIFLKSVLETIIILLLRKADNFENNEPSQKNHIYKAIAYLEIRFREDPTLEETAAYVGLNKNYFSSLFRKQTGKSFSQYLTELKLGYSRNLICATEMNMSEISYQSGFKSFSTFAHEFKTRFGDTPLQYRKKTTR